MSGILKLKTIKIAPGKLEAYVGNYLKTFFK